MRKGLGEVRLKGEKLQEEVMILIDLTVKVW
jgi:hypothetical protein